MAKSRYSKDQIPYWKESIHKVPYTYNGERCLSTHYSVKIRHDGIRLTINLGTANRDIAAEKARDLYRHIQAEGWKVATPVKSDEAVSPEELRIGDLLGAYRKADIIHPPTALPIWFAARGRRTRWHPPRTELVAS